MQVKRKGAGAADEDRGYEQAILVHVIEAYPETLRLSDLLREFASADEFSERDAVERAVRECVKGGLFFRCEGAVLPTRTALQAYELLMGAA